MHVLRQVGGGVELFHEATPGVTLQQTRRKKNTQVSIPGDRGGEGYRKHLKNTDIQLVVQRIVEAPARS